MKKKKWKLSKRVVKLRRKDLNKKLTPYEIEFRNYLHRNGITKFETNKPIGMKYFGDFVFNKIKLIVELDGNHHYLDTCQVKWDKQRDLYLRRCGYMVMRIKNHELDEKKKEIIEYIKKEYTREKITKFKKKRRVFKTNYQKEIKNQDLMRQRFEEILAKKKKEKRRFLLKPRVKKESIITTRYSA